MQSQQKEILFRIFTYHGGFLLQLLHLGFPHADLLFDVVLEAGVLLSRTANSRRIASVLGGGVLVLLWSLIVFGFSQIDAQNALSHVSVRIIPVDFPTKPHNYTLGDPRTYSRQARATSQEIRIIDEAPFDRKPRLVS